MHFLIRTICILIAFLVAAKEVVAFCGELQSNEYNVFTALDHQSLDVWLCECEEGSERNETDESDFPFDSDNHAFCVSIENVALVWKISAKTSAEVPLSNRHLFITFRNMRL
ncbi:MAG: hypothetical protein ACKO7B_07425 [Flavobacteriales bacterium]